MPQTEVPFVSQEVAAFAGPVLQVGPRPGCGFVFQPIGVKTGVDADFLVGNKLHSGFWRVNIIPGEIIVAGPRLVEAVKSIEALVVVIHAVFVAGTVAVKYTGPGLPFMIEGIAEFHRPSQGVMIPHGLLRASKFANTTELFIDVGVKIETTVGKNAINPQARRINVLIGLAVADNGIGRVTVQPCGPGSRAGS